MIQSHQTNKERQIELTSHTWLLIDVYKTYKKSYKNGGVLIV